MPYYQFVHGKVLFIGWGVPLLDGVLVYHPGVPCVGQAPGTHGSPPASTSQWWPFWFRWYCYSSLVSLSWNFDLLGFFALIFGI